MTLEAASRSAVIGLSMLTTIAILGVVVSAAYQDTGHRTDSSEPPLIRVPQMPWKLPPESRLTDVGPGANETRGLDRLLPEAGDEPGAGPADPALQPQAVDYVPAPTAATEPSPIAKSTLAEPLPAASAARTEPSGIAKSALSEPPPAARSAIREPLPAARSAMSEPVPAARSAMSEPLPAARSAMSEPLPAARSAATEPLPAATSALSEPLPAAPPVVIRPASAQAAPAARTGPATAAGAEYRVQLLATSDQAAAERARDGLVTKFGALLADYRSHVEKADLPAGSMYRVQIGPFDGRAAAEAKCAELKRQQAACFALRFDPRT